MSYTSTKVKQKYNEKTYTRCFADLRNEVYTEIEKIIEETGLSRAEFLKMLVSEKYGVDLVKLFGVIICFTI